LCRRRHNHDLRHSFASLLIHEGVSVLEVARQLGNSPDVTLTTYAHVFEEFEPAARVTAGDAIEAARGEFDVRGEYAEAVDADGDNHHDPASMLKADARTRTGDPFITSHVGLACGGSRNQARNGLNTRIPTRPLACVGCSSWRPTPLVLPLFMRPSDLLPPGSPPTSGQVNGNFESGYPTRALFPRIAARVDAGQQRQRSSTDVGLVLEGVLEMTTTSMVAGRVPSERREASLLAWFQASGRTSLEMPQSKPFSLTGD